MRSRANSPCRPRPGESPGPDLNPFGQFDQWSAPVLLGIEDAVRLGQERIAARHGAPVSVPDPLDTLAWPTWADIGAHVATALRSYDNADESKYNAVARVAVTVAEALKAHA